MSKFLPDFMRAARRVAAGAIVMELRKTQSSDFAMPDRVRAELVDIAAMLQAQADTGEWVPEPDQKTEARERLGLSRVVRG